MYQKNYFFDSQQFEKLPIKSTPMQKTPHYNTIYPSPEGKNTFAIFGKRHINSWEHKLSEIFEHTKKIFKRNLKILRILKNFSNYCLN